MNQLLKQLVIDNQRNIDLNIEFATASQIESSVNQINKLKLIEQIIKNDLDQLSQIMKKQIKDLNNCWDYLKQNSNLFRHKYKYKRILIQQQEIIPAAIQNTKIRFSEKDKGDQMIVLDEGRGACGGLLAKLTSRSCLCESVLPKNVESTFAIKYINGNVYIGICKRDIIRNANYQPYLQILVMDLILLVILVILILTTKKK